MFSKRHYQAVAKWLKEIKPEVNSMARQHMFVQWKCTVNKFANQFQADNPKFSADKYRKACGL